MSQLQLVITLRKPVSDQAESELLYDWVKNKIKDKPDIKISGHTSNHFEPMEEPDVPG